MQTDEYKKALIRYVFESVLSFCLSFSVLFILALILGILKTALIIGLTGAVLKTFTGGLHMSTPLRCAIGGAITLVAISYLSIFLPLTAIPTVIIFIILAVINAIVWVKAPREAKGKPLSDKQKVVLAWLSRIIILAVSIGIFFLSRKVWWINEVFYGTVFQVINLLDLSAWGTEKFDNLLGKVERKAIF